ncbi:MAG TPA: selenocysteine-specific translation elongation factor [Solirubrobacterales bacterium]|nr:selenocysteine-specific translation elongation factor [Solirubrobacterales bacterium]
MGAAPLTVGTAGHIDHGKTALVRALTGHDTDRLAEERRRGISIELGFAALELGERRLSLVDVPGHERLVRTMIAGASGIDLFLLVVAADDGPMPQTREHLAVLRALGVEPGAIALSKVDLVDAEARLLAEAECAELLPGAPLVAVSARSGEGLDSLRATLGDVAAKAEPAPALAAAEPLLHVDRRFTVTGRGTVVTGTLWSGTLARGQRVVLLPGERDARIRSIEVHGADRELAGPRQRVALNLAGPRREEVARGDVVTVPGAAVATTYRLDAELLEGAAEIVAERRAQVHLGTRESPARVVDLGAGSVQLRLERPLLARRGDRVVVRRIAPPDTLGGGIVRDPAPRRHGPLTTSPDEASRPEAPQDLAVRARRGCSGSTRSAEIAPPGPLARRVLAALEGDGARPRPPGPLAEALGTERRQVEAALRELVAAGEAVRIARDIAYPTPAYARLREAIAGLSRRGGSTSIAEVRDELGISRKYAQALLERLDAERVLRREGDRHYPREVPQRA